LFFRSDIANGNEMRSFIARLAVNICRIMSTIAMLRVLEIPQPYQLKSSDRYAPVPDKEIPTDNVKDGIITRWDITITPEDFKAVLGLVKASLSACHAYIIFPAIFGKSPTGPMPTVTPSSMRWVTSSPVHS